MSTPDSSLMRSIHELGALSFSDLTLPEIFDRIVSLANAAVPASAMAGLTLDVGGRASTAAYTDEVVPQIDEAQNRLGGRGPCVDAARTGVAFIISSTAEEERWGEFSARCVASGVTSTISIPVVARSAKRAALNLYATTEPFSISDVEVADRFAKQVAVTIENAETYYSTKQLAEQLQVALDARVVIEQAKGILIAQGCSEADAFDVLRRASQRENRKLRQVATDLVNEARRRYLDADRDGGDARHDQAFGGVSLEHDPRWPGARLEDGNGVTISFDEAVALLGVAEILERESEDPKVLELVASISLRIRRRLDEARRPSSETA